MDQSRNFGRAGSMYDHGRAVSTVRTPVVSDFRRGGLTLVLMRAQVLRALGCAEPSCCVRGSSGGALARWVASKSILKGEDLWNTSPLVTSITLPISCRRRRRHR